jgi:tetratricopeptide (TPR) repeat protein
MAESPSSNLQFFSPFQAGIRVNLPRARFSLPLMMVGFLALTATITLCTGCAPASRAEGTSSTYQTSVDLQSQSSFSRLKLSLDESFKPTMKDVADGFELVVPSATLMDLGVPFGGENEFNRYLAKVSDNRVTKISVVETEGSLVIKGKYHFPAGANALAHPVMEHFDFRQNENGKYVIDFWYKKGFTILEQQRADKLAHASKTKNELEGLRKKESERQAVREKRISEAKNAIAFCEQPYDRSNTVFLKFHPSHQIFSFAPYFPENIPDHRFEYSTPKGKGEEADMVRLALKLSSENNHALVIKTVDFIGKEYPKSPYTNEMRFLKANAYYRLEMEPKGRAELVELAKVARGTDVGVQASAFLAVQAYNKREWLASLDAFNTIRRENPRNPLMWLFRYGTAEALYQIKQSDQAALEFEWLSNNAPRTQIKAETAFKKGDVYFDRNQFALAIDTYAKAADKFKSQLNVYPQVLMNLAESYFQLEEYKKADVQFKRYLDLGRSQPAAWRASLRIAEIQALNQKQSPEVEAAFTNTINQYPRTPGATIARLRLIPCGNHGGFDLGGVERFVQSPDVQNFDGGEDLYTSSFKELVALNEVRAFLTFGQDQKAIDQGILALRENPTIEVRRLIEQAMSGGIKRILATQLKSGDQLSVISTYEKYGDYLPPAFQDPQVDDLRMDLAKFASEKKLSTFALKIIEPYRQMNEAEQRDIIHTVEKNLALEGSVEQDERNYIEAKTLWNSDQAEAQGDKFITRLDAVSSDSTYAWDRDLLKGLYYSEKHEDSKAMAAAALVAAKLRSPGTSSAARLSANEKAQVWFWVAELASRANEPEQAEKGYHEARMIKASLDKAKVSEKDRTELSYQHVKSTPSVSYLYMSEGEMLERQQKWKEAVALYTEAIENKVGGNHVLYAHARALLKVGGRESTQTASRSLEKIKLSQDDDVWKQLAQKALEEIAKEGKIDEKRKQ